MSGELVDSCLANGTFKKLFDRLAQLTGEKPRSKKIPVPEYIASSEQVEIKLTSSPKKQAPDTSTKPVEKKGVGYTTGNGKVWDVDEYLAQVEAKNHQISKIIGIVKHTLKNSNSEDLKALVLESAILPILESALRSCSLLEMAKETNLYNSYLDLICEMC
jgi:hypothetical protein